MASGQLIYTDRSGAEIEAIEFHPEEFGDANGAAARPAPEGTKHLSVTLADGRTATRTAVPEGDGPGTFHVEAESERTTTETPRRSRKATAGERNPPEAAAEPEGPATTEEPAAEATGREG